MKKTSISIINTGIRQLIDHPIYPKKEGILISFSSAIERTIKFGALPIYVLAPMNTAPQEIAIRNIFGICPIAVEIMLAPASPDDAAVVKNTK